MRQMLCVVVYILSSVDHRLKHAAGTCDAALPVIGLVIGLIITGTILVSSAVVLSGILSPHAYIATVRSGLTSIQSSICTLYRHVQNAITSIAMTARCVVQAVDKLRRSIISAFLLSKSATTHFLSRVTSRIRRAPGMLVDILTVSTAQRLLFKFRSVPLIALRIPLAILEVLLSFAVRVGSGEPFFVAGGLVGECLEGVLRLCWRTAVDVCESVEEKARVAFSQQPTRILTAEDSFATDATLCDVYDASDIEDDDQPCSADKLNLRAPAYTPSAPLLRIANAGISLSAGAVKSHDEPLDPRKEAFVPLGLRMSARVQTSCDTPAVPLEVETVLPLVACADGAPCELAEPSDRNLTKRLDPRKAAFVPTHLRVSQEEGSGALSITLKALAIAIPAISKPAQAVIPKSSEAVAATAEVENEQPVRKQHGSRVPTWLRRQRKRAREREAAAAAW